MSRQSSRVKAFVSLRPNPKVRFVKRRADELCRSRDTSIYRKPDLLAMALVVKQDETLDPAHVGLANASRMVAAAQHCVNPIEQARYARTHGNEAAVYSWQARTLTRAGGYIRGTSSKYYIGA